MQNIIDIRSYNELNTALSLAQHTVYKRYLPQLQEYAAVEPTQILLDEKVEDCTRFFQLEELSCKKGEDLFQKLSTVYHASMSLGCNLIVMVDVARIDAPAKIYVGVRNSGEDPEAKRKLSTSFKTLKNGMKSNFPGTKFHDVPAQKDMPELVNDIFGNSVKYISSVSCVAAARDKSKTENKSFIQGLERFIDAMRGNTYTAIFIAEPLTTKEQSDIRSGYEELYSSLSSFEKSVWSYNENMSRAVTESLSKGMLQSITDGTSHTQSHTKSLGINIGANTSRSTEISQGITKNSPSKIAMAGRAISIAGSVLSVVGMAFPIVEPVAIGAGVVGGAMQKGAEGFSKAESIVSTIGKSMGLSGGVNAGYSKTTSDGTTHSETNTTSETKTQGTTDTKGQGKTLQIENVNKPIQEMLQRLEEQLKRTRECEDYGAYSCGAYFMSGKQESSLLAANTYHALMIGEGSSVESGAINFWNGLDEKVAPKIDIMKEYLRRFTHPIFAVPITAEREEVMTYTPGTIVSGLELPLHLGLPTRSVYGLPVMEHAEFGRNVTEKKVFSVSDERKINIGKIYHMGQVEKKSEVKLNVAGLTAHTFITGSTGAGKSNTIYKMLEQINEEDVKFLVVEPAKGEYKDITAFGGKSDVTVYGTNPKVKETEMLQINPFSFPKEVHVLEHLDRLVEIFNVCWPMYAAMPAILKDAIERAYEKAGWDMEMSENKYDDNLFPTFKDVYEQIREVLEESEYSADNKGDYTGALVTRLRSLTTGINGLIFNADEISMEELFDTNVIVDLSRIGSTETKSLIMGLLVLKLQEYRMGVSEANQHLKHVTVLEEAHNLLKRTSSEQSSESGNLLGKSVEMLANSIAEMRTYGEGFIIADQSPGLLDMSVIRNTNTKIILRLPDYEDRELVGRAAGLNDEQIVELAKLDNGVAAVMQSDWLEPVLCQIDKYERKYDWMEEYEKSNEENDSLKKISVEKELLNCIMNNELYRKNDRVDIKKLKDKVIHSKLETPVKCDFMEYVFAEEPNLFKPLQKLLFDFLHAEKAIENAKECTEMKPWLRNVINSLSPSVQSFETEQINLVLGLIIAEKVQRDAEYEEIYNHFTELYIKGRGIV